MIDAHSDFNISKKKLNDLKRYGLFPLEYMLTVFGATSTFIACCLLLAREAVLHYRLGHLQKVGTTKKYRKVVRGNSKGTNGDQEVPPKDIVGDTVLDTDQGSKPEGSQSSTLPSIT